MTATSAGTGVWVGAAVGTVVGAGAVVGEGAMVGAGSAVGGAAAVGSAAGAESGPCGAAQPATRSASRQIIASKFLFMGSTRQHIDLSAAMIIYSRQAVQLVPDSCALGQESRSSRNGRSVKSNDCAESA